MILSSLPQAQAGTNRSMEQFAPSRASRMRYSSSHLGMLKSILGCDRHFLVAQTGDNPFELPGTGPNPRSVCGSAHNQRNIYAPPRVGVNDSFSKL